VTVNLSAGQRVLAVIDGSGDASGFYQLSMACRDDGLLAGAQRHRLERRSAISAFHRQF
jgi:hypothetical protein